MEILKGEPGTYQVSWGTLKVGSSGLIYSYRQDHLEELKALGFKALSEQPVAQVHDQTPEIVGSTIVDQEPVEIPVAPEVAEHEAPVAEEATETVEPRRHGRHNRTPASA
jgi:hypothetical protein